MVSRLGFDTISAFTLALTAAIGAYLPVYLAHKDRAAGGTGRSLVYILGNMFSAGVMLSAGFCHLLGEALKQMPKMQFPLAPFLCGLGYLLTLLADRFVASGLSSSSDGGDHHHHHHHHYHNAHMASPGADLDLHNNSNNNNNATTTTAALHTATTVAAATIIVPPLPLPSSSSPHSPPVDGSSVEVLAGVDLAERGLKKSGVRRSVINNSRREILEFDMNDDDLDATNGGEHAALLLSTSSTSTPLAAAAAANNTNNVQYRGGVTIGSTVNPQQSSNPLVPTSSPHSSFELHHHQLPSSSSKLLPHNNHNNNNNSRGTFLTAVLMGVALVFHSLLEGAAMGAQSTVSNSFHIFIAIVSHKGLAAYALGSSVVDALGPAIMEQGTTGGADGANSSNKKIGGISGLFALLGSTLIRFLKSTGIIGSNGMFLMAPPGFWGVVLPFMFASPLGIFLGYIASDIARGVGAASISALAAGTFLYVAFMEVIPRELREPGWGREKLGMLVAGFAAMSVLAVWA